MTGAGARLGAALARALGGRGCSVAVHYGTNRQGAEEVVRDIVALGGRAKAFGGDLFDAELPERLVREVLGEFGGLDILVNNASYWCAPERIKAEYGLAQETLENWEHTIAVNLRAPFFLMQKCSLALVRSGEGVILNILDRSASEPYLNRASHSIARAGLAAATSLAAATLAGKVRVQALEFGDMLPPAEMPEKERQRRVWSGEEAFVSEVLAALEPPTTLAN